MGNIFGYLNRKSIHNVLSHVDKEYKITLDNVMNDIVLMGTNSVPIKINYSKLYNVCYKIIENYV